MTAADEPDIRRSLEMVRDGLFMLISPRWEIKSRGLIVGEQLLDLKFENGGFEMTISVKSAEWLADRRKELGL